MHRLVPHFILEKYAAGESAGRFSGSALFIDISGFTVVTEALMEHGQHGAEVLATVMRAIFDPLIARVFAHQGFIVGFAGDAFTAIFPDDADLAPSPLRALAAGWEMQQALATHARQETPYGTFTFSGKVGIATGDVAWGIVRAAEGRRAAYYFKGSAVDGCAAAEHAAARGELIVHAGTCEAVREMIVVAPSGEHARVTAIHGPLPDPGPIHPPAHDLDQAAHFFPRALLTQSLPGEFRAVLNLFVSVQGIPTPEQLTRFMRVVFSLQDRFGGFLNRIDFGDKGCNLLLFWGAPVRYENDVNRVLNFVLALRERAPLPLRTGLTYRIAHAGFIGSDLHEEYTCYGRGVNLAARFMMAAPWGEMWVDEEVHARASSGFRLDYVDVLSFKGIAEKQPVFRLTGQRESAPTPFFRGALVGRRAEIARLTRFVQPLWDGRCAGAVIVTGEAGIGKSRLVHEFVRASGVRENGQVFVCQTDEILRQSLNPFRYWLRDYFEQSRARGEAANKRRFARVFQALVADVPEPALRADLQRSRSFLGALVDLRWPDSLYEQLEPQLRFENTLDGLKALLKAESLRRPVVVQLEDAHWLDDDSRHFLRRLTRNVAAYPLAVVMTSREGMPEGLLDPAVSRMTVDLVPLAAGDVTMLAQGLLGTAPAAPLRTFLEERTDGNPFFVEQLLLYLAENDLLETEEFATTLRGSGGPVPTDVQAVLVARLDRLPRPVKEVVQRAAVLGREFDTSVLQAMAPDPALEDRLNMAASEAIWSPLAARRYLFRHALMRDAAYGMQVRTRLHMLHRRAAEAHEAVYQDDLAPNYGQIAYHYDQAEVVVKALDYYERAADDARDKYRNEEALAYYARALSLLAEDKVETRFRLLRGREAVLNWLGRREEEARVLEEMAKLAERLADPGLQAEAALRRSAYALATGAYDAALDAAQQSAAYATQAGDRLAEARAHHRRGRTYWQQGHYEQAKRHLQQALTMARDDQSQKEEAQCLYDLSVVAFYQSEYGAALDTLQQALPVYQALDDRRGEISCNSLFGIIFSKQGRYAAAQTVYERALALCRDAGWRFGEGHILAQMADNYFELGDYGQSRTFHEDALAVYWEIGHREGEAASLDTIGLILYHLDRYDAATDFLQQAIAIQRGIDNVRGLGYSLTHLGYSLAKSGALDAARSALAEALEIRQGIGADGLALDTRAGLALVALERGKVQVALGHVEGIWSWMAANDPAGVELPVQVALICYRVLQAATETGAPPVATADEILAGGYALLQERANRIQDDALRRQFLENVPYHRELMAAWNAARD